MKQNTKGKHLDARQRAKYRIRKKVSGTNERPRISVWRSGRHTYAQVISDDTGTTLASASTLEEAVIKAIDEIDAEGVPNDSKSTKSVRAAKAVGLLLAKRCEEKNIKHVVFDRNGSVYHGRVKAVADGAREAGLLF